jgi:prepilin-type N-terminal cleavage/methylation domain-containing protein
MQCEIVIEIDSFNVSQSMASVSPTCTVYFLEDVFVRSQSTFSTVSRAGFTVIELAVVVGIIGVIVSITLPAIQAAREASRRSQCTNNLKQLALAVHSFENSFRKFPSSEPISLEGRPQPHGWLIYVTPYIEKQILYDKYKFNKPWHDPDNYPVVGLRTEVFECPATPDEARRDFAPPPAAEAFAATTDYATVTHVDPRLVTQGLVDRAGVGAMPKKAQPIRDHIQDGLSNTILLIESAGRPQVWREGSAFEAPPNTRTLGGAWASPTTDISLIGSSEDGCTTPGKYAINRTNGEPAGNVYPHPQYGTDGTGQVYSFHSGCVNSVFADGSVHTLDEETDVRVLAKFITRAGREVHPTPK